MAGITALGTTYNLPNFVGELFAASPEDTPFLSAIGGLTGGESVGSTVFSWQGYDLRDGEDVYQTYETKWRGIEAMLPTLQLLDLTPYGRQETWEDSPAGWPQEQAGSWWRRDGRPVAQWTRTDAAVE